MSVGLLYEGSAHPPTMQILLVLLFMSSCCAKQILMVVGDLSSKYDFGP